MISIHALLAESDVVVRIAVVVHIAISIHALLAESDQFCGCQRGPGIAFLSTLSLRRATAWSASKLAGMFLSTLSLRRATDSSYGALDGASISIHALLAESDVFSLFGVFFICIFLSTLSLRRATIRATVLEEVIPYFYPRSPCGERRKKGKVTNGYDRFLSTLSLRRATGQKNSKCPCRLISIHALLAESD